MEKVVEPTSGHRLALKLGWKKSVEDATTPNHAKIVIKRSKLD